MIKNILYILAAGDLSGSNKSFLTLLDGLDKNEFKPFVIIPRSGMIKDELNKRGVYYKEIKFFFSIWPIYNKSIKSIFLWPIRFLRDLIFNFITVIRLIYIIFRSRIDIVHTNAGPVGVGYLASRICNVRHIWHIREFQDLDFGMTIFPTKKKFLKKLNKSNTVIFVSEAVKNNFPITNSGVVIYNGVSDKKEISNKYRENCIVFAGRLSEEKCLAEAIIAFASLCNENRIPNDYRFLIAGTYSSKNYKNTIDGIISSFEKSIKKRIVFLGHVNNVIELMEKNKFFLMTSKNEAFGRVTAEAMFAGCLVVARRSGGSVELLSDREGDLGYFFRENVELADVLENAINQYDYIAYKKINKAFEKARLNYANEIYVNKVVSIYRNDNLISNMSLSR